MANKNQTGSKNNNPHGHNQYTNDWLSPAKDHPFATAAAAAAAVGAGVFLWAKRDRVGNQVTRISETANEMAGRASDKASQWIDQVRGDSAEREVSVTPDATATGRSPALSAKSGTANTGTSRATGAEPVSY
ncbi:hypothetical protein H8M03_01750 [Sphingomonas sabuli]|uniref:Uncharacterized protein n=1 Tax=Sphingomonas sabuli TaxID=2764186 RepID=A0A7G9L3B3_9SPHN|nr:hypothetical protein [Sphingomonas sabuli]QNM83112.1 hypothetical protein H8M03_01750 [Sphingomonas sabuli]